MSNAAWEFKQVHSDVHKLKIYIPNQDTQSKILLISDIHWDNPKCDRGLLKEHLQEALITKSPVTVCGDTFCAMQGKWDARKSKTDLRAEHTNDHYLDSLVDTAVEWFLPYKEVLTLFGLGNHETSILRHHETNLLDRFCSALRREGGNTYCGGYQGWLVFNVCRSSPKTKTKSEAVNSFNMFYYHGSGAGAPVTKGAIEFNRLVEQVNADIIWSGHIHRMNTNHQLVRDLNRKHRPILKQRDYLRTSTYKIEGDRPKGWAVEKRLGARPLGGYWLKLETDYSDGNTFVTKRSYTNTTMIPTGNFEL